MENNDLINDLASVEEVEIVEEKNQNKIFSSFKIKDIVFLAIITACTFVLCAFMPLLVNIPFFGIIQIGLSLQFSILPVIALMKVRKIGALSFQAILMGCFLVLMFPPMAFIAVCGIVAELIVIAIFRGYKNDWACVLAGTLYMPFTLPFMFLYYNAIYTIDSTAKAAVSLYVLGNAPLWIIALVCVGIVVLCFIGSLIGMKIARELQKSGIIKS